jgi:2,3-bisphosphoglycerate-independent phosphoglycerate mutase
MENSKQVALLILDGWGYGKKDHSDAIFQANTPFFDSLIKKYPNAYLHTDGEYVGLPKGQMGNSEVGHLNIGAGRVVYQDLVKINKAVTDGSLLENKELMAAFEYAKSNNRNIHFIGLVSDGGIHSHQSHLIKLCEAAYNAGIDKTYIHAFTDGRDTDPNSGSGFLQEVIDKTTAFGSKIASITGRYYAMDRDLRWKRIKLAYDALVSGIGTNSKNIIQTIQESYDNGVSDEFLKPIISVDESGEAIAKIAEGDIVICFNYRTDRCREITRALSQEDFIEHNMNKLKLYYVTMTNYDDSFENIKVLFKKDNLKNTLGEVLSGANKTQIRIAETEKYPHVTFFFSGGREIPFKGERRLMAQSPKVATYDLQPEMNAIEIRDKIISEINENTADFICLNFANPDMVGHTGVFNAIKKAVETVDSYTKDIVEAGIEKNYSFIIIADHGNADYAINEDGSPNTAHTTNLVPIVLIDNDYKNITSGKLADVAPSILQLMNVPVPKEMDGDVLVK